MLKNRFKMPENLVTKRYLNNRLREINKVFSKANEAGTLNPALFKEEELQACLFSSEQIANICRVLNSKKHNPIDYFGPLVDSPELPEILFENGILKITVPLTVKSKQQYSRYIPMLVNTVLAEYEDTFGAICIQSPFSVICKRYVNTLTDSSVSDNDNFERHNIVNQIMVHLNTSDSVNNMSHYSVITAQIDALPYCEYYVCSVKNTADLLNLLL